MRNSISPSSAGGGQGGGNLAAVSGENIVALCDVDEDRAKGPWNSNSKAKHYSDYRKMLGGDGSSIDAVDGLRSPITAMPLPADGAQMGKHVFRQKPLTQRGVGGAAGAGFGRKEKNLATQMGNQGSADTGGLRRAAEMVRRGVIGKVTELHVWTNRPIWPQGISDRPGKCRRCRSTLAWDCLAGACPGTALQPRL